MILRGKSKSLSVTFPLIVPARTALYLDASSFFLYLSSPFPLPVSPFALCFGNNEISSNENRTKATRDGVCIFEQKILDRLKISSRSAPSHLAFKYSFKSKFGSLVFLLSLSRFFYLFVILSSYFSLFPKQRYEKYRGKKEKKGKEEERAEKDR